MTLHPGDAHWHQSWLRGFGRKRTFSQILGQIENIWKQKMGTPPNSKARGEAETPIVSQHPLILLLYPLPFSSFPFFFSSSSLLFFLLPLLLPSLLYPLSFLSLLCPSPTLNFPLLFFFLYFLCFSFLFQPPLSPGMPGI